MLLILAVETEHLLAQCTKNHLCIAVSHYVHSITIHIESCSCGHLLDRMCWLSSWFW